jgi:prepilin-type N-terminal cleavage/methylation domain-containing protein
MAKLEVTATMLTSQKATIRSNRKRGYTLMEMSVVIVIIALFATMVVPAMAKWRAGNDYRAFPSKLLNLVGKAKQDAIDNKQTRSIGFDATTDEFRMYWTDPQSNNEQEGQRLALPDGLDMGRMVYLGNDTSADTWQMTFYADGTAEDSGVELRNQDQYLSVSTNSLGQIKMIKDQLPDPSTQRWSGGDLETRQ